MSTDESCLKIIPSYEVGEAASVLGTISCYASGVKHPNKLRIPRTNGDNVEQMVNEVFMPILKAASNAPTADKDCFSFVYQLFDTGIYETFKGAADSLTVDVDNPQQGDFIKVVRKFLAEVTTCDTMKDNILRYLECSVKKPREMEPHKFWLRFSTILQQSKYFTGIKPHPTKEEIIDWYFRAFPLKYRINYKAAHGDNKPDAVTITKHMTLCHQMDVADGTFKKKPSTKDKPVTKDEKGRDRRRRDKDKKTFNRDQVKLRDDGPCPIHPNGVHTWKECSLNPANKDDKKRERRSSKDKDDKKKKESKGNHSHHVQQVESEHEKEDGETSDSDSDSSEEEENSNKRMKTVSHHQEDADVSNDLEDLAVADNIFEEED
jgi:hypothetical protein